MFWKLVGGFFLEVSREVFILYVGKVFCESLDLFFFYLLLKNKKGGWMG